MTALAEISPNEPDVIPDYVDGKGTAAAPPHRAAEAPKTPEAPPAASAANAAHREGECVPNIPDIAPAFLTDAEEKALGDAPALPRQALPAAAPAAPPWWKWQATAAVFLAALFGVLVFSQAVSVAALASSLPVWAQYALLIPFGFCCLAVLLVAASLVRAWFRLRAVRQVDLAALEEIRLRAQTRQDGVERCQAARAQLESYLGAYPFSPESRAGLSRAGVPPERIEALAAGRDFLVGRAQDSRTWLAEFREHYQDILDRAASARVASWSAKAAGCVIASPLPLLDAVLVLGIAMKLVRDLSAIYNVRTGRAGSLVILKKAIAAAFIAGVAEDATEAAGGLAADHLTELVGGTLAARLTGLAAPKLAEGALNALFIHRLGKATIRLLQPALPAEKKSRESKGKE